jgi:GNAT superfamily N-acetyltransferase
MDEGVSLAAYNRETQKLTGVAIVSIARNNEKAHFEFECESEEQATILQFLAAAEDGIDIFKKYGVEEYGELLMLSIDQEFRGEGLATEFHIRIFEMLKDMGIKLTAVSSSSPYTRKILERMGFEEVSRKYFREMLDTQGRVLCPNAGDDEFLARLVLRL